MNGSNRKPLRVGGLAFLSLLAAGAALAIGAGDGLDRRQALRAAQYRVMDIFAQDYAGADWSLVVADLVANPGDPANTAFMSVPLSLANVYLNRYETGHAEANLERSFAIFEWVAANRWLWGARDGSGSVVSSLDIGVSRLRAECDVGTLGSRIDDLWAEAMAITADEAGALIGIPDGSCAGTLGMTACTRSATPYPSDDESKASRAALFAAASSFLAQDPRAQAWAQAANDLAESFIASSCVSSVTEIVLSQGALSKQLASDDWPDFAPTSAGLASQWETRRCAAYPTAYVTGGPVGVVTPGDSLAAAISDSRLVAFYLSEVFLWYFPPGSQCGEVAPDQGGGDRGR